MLHKPHGNDGYNGPRAGPRIHHCYRRLQLLHEQDSAAWEVRYIIMLWLSIVIMIPFDLSTIDSSLAFESNNGAESLIQKMLGTCMYITI